MKQQKARLYWLFNSSRSYNWYEFKTSYNCCLVLILEVC